jgi:hypothetical protein
MKQQFSALSPTFKHYEPNFFLLRATVFLIIAVLQARAEHPKLMLGHGPRTSGLRRSLKMSQRRKHVH